MLAIGNGHVEALVSEAAAHGAGLIAICGEFGLSLKHALKPAG